MALADGESAKCLSGSVRCRSKPLNNPLILNVLPGLPRCDSSWHVDQGLNKRSSKAFRIRSKGRLPLSFDPDCLKKFEQLVREAIRKCRAFDSPGELETHYCQRRMVPEDTSGARTLEQVTVFAEARFVTDDAFVENRLKTRVRHKVDSISLIFDDRQKELDVVALGGRQFIEDVARAFFEAFSDGVPPLEPLIRRKINFAELLTRPDLTIGRPEPLHARKGGRNPYPITRRHAVYVRCESASPRRTRCL